MRQVDSAYLKMLARMAYKAAWEFRLVMQDGKAYPIPSRAVLSAPASSAVDSGTWEMPVSIMASSMPRGVTPQQYHRIEVDRVVAGNRMPYFRGIIDEVTQGWRVENGVEVETVNLQAFGVLQRAKGYRLNRFRLDPGVVAMNTELAGICATRRYRPNSSITAGNSEQLIGGASPFDPATKIAIYASGTIDAPTSPYTLGTPTTGDYWVDDSTFPVTIHWRVTPATDRIIEWPNVERFLAPVTGYESGGVRMVRAPWIILPYGRSYDDLFHTYIADWDDSGSAPKIQLADSTGWRDLFGAYGGEYAAIVTSDGATHILEVASGADGSGWITLDAAETLPASLQVGDPIRLATSEGYAAWDDDQLYTFGPDWNPRLFTAHPNLGIAVPAARAWDPADRVEAFISIITEDPAVNGAEYAVGLLLSTWTGLFDPSDIITEHSGVIVKNRTWTGVDLSEALADFKDQAFSPSTFAHDTQDGKVVIKPYRQKTEPDWVLRGIQSIEETEIPEPITAVTVIAEDEEVNVAPEWYSYADFFEHPERLVDGIKDGLAATSPTGYEIFPSRVDFAIPEAAPSTVYPLIDRIRIHGTGMVTVAVSYGLTTHYLAGYTWREITGGSLEISGTDLASIMPTTACTLTFYFSPVTSGDGSIGAVQTPKSCSEIEILTKKAGWWRAALTDDTDLAPADQGPDAFGMVWRQPDPSRRQSYRYAPPDYLKRVQVLYPDKAREKVLSMAAISQQDTRDYAERWTDEFLRGGKTYRVTAPYDDRAELGDTVTVAWKGFRKDLFLWAIEGPQDPRSPLATYTFIDYGL